MPSGEGDPGYRPGWAFFCVECCFFVVFLLLKKPYGSVPPTCGTSFELGHMETSGGHWTHLGSPGGNLSPLGGHLEEIWTHMGVTWAIWEVIRGI